MQELRIQHGKDLARFEKTFREQHPDSEERSAVAFPLLREIIGVDSVRKFDAIHIDPFMRGEEGGEWYKMYEDGSWRFDEAYVGRKFITSDIPSTSMRLGSEPQYSNLIFFFMPLWSDLQLMGMCKDARMESGLAPKSIEMGEQQMDLANLTVFKSAFRFVYSSSKKRDSQGKGAEWALTSHTLNPRIYRSRCLTSSESTYTIHPPPLSLTPVTRYR